MSVLVVTGAGGMGQAVVRRLGSGRAVVLADFDAAHLATVDEDLTQDGYAVHPVPTDVSNPAAVARLASTAAALGPIDCIVHTAGVSPTQATARQIIAVDFVGTALMLDAFAPHVTPGTVAVCIASMAAMFSTLPADTEQLLATTPTNELAALAALDPDRLDAGTAYVVAKRGVQVRVEAAALEWGRRGGRVVSLSPGIIATPQGIEELAGESGDSMRAMIDMSALKRLGTPDDIAATVEFLVSPAASLITGTDILVDGGVVAAVRRPGAQRHSLPFASWSGHAS
jgi:NAD(P)-dependent dehydrogenase (short-subunit alcohol dehydrogenase family)